MTNQPKVLSISLPSVQSLFVYMRFQGQALSTGTAFAVNSAAGPMLITNRHNVTGRRQDNNQPLSQHGGVPDEIIIAHNLERVGMWEHRKEQLFSESGEPRWIEHPTLGARADFVALPLTDLTGVKLYPYDPSNPGPDLLVQVPEMISVVGFPFGLQGGGSLSIWATGFIATEPLIDYNELPVFLIDCRSRQGQSGSPVIAQRNGGSVAMGSGGVAFGPGVFTRFLGIYSGRVNRESDLGIVWKAHAIAELIASISSTPN